MTTEQEKEVAVMAENPDNLKRAMQPVLDSLCALDGVDAAVANLTPRERAVLRSAMIELGLRSALCARSLDGALVTP